VNANQVGIEGVSRYGKAALVTMAFDTRFAVALIVPQAIHPCAADRPSGLFRRNRAD
jgi:hypothetical protein